MPFGVQSSNAAESEVIITMLSQEIFFVSFKGSIAHFHSLDWSFLFFQVVSKTLAFRLKEVKIIISNHICHYYSPFITLTLFTSVNFPHANRKFA